MVNSDQYQAKLSALVKPKEGRCLNVMDAAAHALQAQHRSRYAGVSMAPMHQACQPAIDLYPSFGKRPLSAH